MSSLPKNKIVLVAGARPNFIKINALYKALHQSNIFDPVILHTGQHYDHNMSQSFFDEFDLPKPNINFGVGSGNHAEQTAAIMVAFDQYIEAEHPKLVIVVGDVNSTVACSLVAKKKGVKVVHVEAGLRSFDERMPEEINRKVTDTLSDMLFTTESAANENLRKEGVNIKKIHFVGNTMIDTLAMYIEKITTRKYCKRMNLFDYAVITIHRPSNVDNDKQLKKVIDIIKHITQMIKVVWPIHPRTSKRIEQLGLLPIIEKQSQIMLVPPLSYIDFLSLVADARFTLTDSGGIQEETTYLGVPCLTMRENTERPVTITKGTNILVGLNTEKIVSEIKRILETKNRITPSIPLWDGNASQRIVQVLQHEYPAH